MDMLIFLPYHAPALFDRAEKAAKHGQGVVSAILCGATAEAFTHDLTEWYKFAADHRTKYQNKKTNLTTIFDSTEVTPCFSEIPYCTDIEDSILKRLTELEDKRAPVECKYCAIHEITQNGKRWNKGAKPYQDFALLMRIRNDIVHVKGERLEQSLGSLSEPSMVEGYPKPVKSLQQRGIIQETPHLNRGSSWLNLIETEDFSNWCVRSIKNFINATRDLLPDTKLSARFKVPRRSD